MLCNTISMSQRRVRYKTDMRKMSIWVVRVCFGQHKGDDRWVRTREGSKIRRPFRLCRRGWGYAAVCAHDGYTNDNDAWRNACSGISDDKAKLKVLNDGYSARRRMCLCVRVVQVQGRLN